MGIPIPLCDRVWSLDGHWSDADRTGPRHLHPHGNDPASRHAAPPPPAARPQIIRQLPAPPRESCPASRKTRHNPSPPHATVTPPFASPVPSRSTRTQWSIPSDTSDERHAISSRNVAEASRATPRHSSHAREGAQKFTRPVPLVRRAALSHPSVSSSPSPLQRASLLPTGIRSADSRQSRANSKRDLTYARFRSSPRTTCTSSARLL